MSPAIRAELLRLLIVSGLAILLGSWFGHALLGFSVGLLCLIGWHCWQMLQLLSWTGRRMKGAIPELSGLWGELVRQLVAQRQRQRQIVGKMRQTVKRISQLTNAVDEGILVLTRDQRLEWWNAASSALLNLQPADKDKQIINFLRDPAFVRFIGEDDLEGSIELAAPANPSRWLLFTASRFGDGDIVLVVMDITRLKNLERTRKEFVGNVSHELRTPLTVLRGYLETLSGGMVADNPAVQRACEQMNDQVLRMQALADDLIRLSRLESEEGKFELEVVDLSPLLETIVEEARVLGGSKYHLQLRCPEVARIMGRRSDIHSAISNLVVNAVRHNPQGANIEVNLSELDDKKFRLSVKDDGVGIGREAIPRLTERFYRTDSSRSSSAGGTGLGLAIVKHVVNRVGGTLDIESTLGQGAEFICTFMKASVKDDTKAEKVKGSGHSA